MTLSARCIKNELDDCKWGLHLTLLTILHRSFISLEGRGPDDVHVYVCMYDQMCCFSTSYAEMDEERDGP